MQFLAKKTDIYLAFEASLEDLKWKTHTDKLKEIMVSIIVGKLTDGLIKISELRKTNKKIGIE